MPIIRLTDQKEQTLEEFYQELLSAESTDIETQIGSDMLSLLATINEAFSNTTLYGLTSLYRLVIQPTDDWKDKWHVIVNSIGNNEFHIEYRMPQRKSPWKQARVYGETKSIEEAKEYLIIAMTECEGWVENKELRKLYNKIKRQKTGTQEFTLWLEFEAADMGDWDIKNEFCNIHVKLADGRHYGLTVWTYSFLATSVRQSEMAGENLNGLYQTPPDLFVKELTRDCIQKTIEDLLKIDDLEKVLNHTILGYG